MEKVFEGEGVNPDLHLTVEATILEQVESGNPPETGKAYRALGLQSRHRIRGEETGGRCWFY